VGRRTLQTCNVLAPARPAQPQQPQPTGEVDLSAAPPFTLADLKNAIPSHLFKRKPGRSMAYLFRDVAVVVGLAAAAQAVNQWWAWPLYWVAQGTMFWALFVVGHDCGHGSFSNNKKLNDLVGNITHSSILVPYHGWRISHRTHHANHGHVENDESWYPVTKSNYQKLDSLALLGRLSFPLALFAYPFYLMSRSPGKEGSHFDPKCNLFTPAEGKLIQTSNKFFAGMLAVLAGCTLWLGPLAMFNLYLIPYWINVMWLDAVTYLHHHGPDDENIKVPWYRGEEWSYLRGGLSTLDRDYGIFNNIHHDIGTHVVHHLLPQIPHYNLCEATEAVKPVMGPYYREPEPSKGPIPFHLVAPLVRSLGSDHFVEDTGDVVYYQKDPNYWQKVRDTMFKKNKPASV
jgi:omega-3 fatty acid desaturase (delta-15 desaturase)